MSSDSLVPPPGPDHLLLVLQQLGEAAGLYQQVIADRLGLTRTDLEVLSLVGLRGARTAGQLAEATGLTTGAVTGVIDRLERAGYARRAPHPGDRRRVMVALVPERLLPVLRVHEPLHTAVHALDAGFGPAQRAVIADYVMRASAIFRAEALRLRAEAAFAPRRGLTRPGAPRPPRTHQAPPRRRAPATAGSRPGSPPRRSATRPPRGR